MAANKTVVADLGSQLVEEMRLQINYLTNVLEAVLAAVETDATTTYDNLADIVDGTTTTDKDKFVNILTRPTMPRAPSRDDG